MTARNLSRLIPGKRYRWTVEGVANQRQFFVFADDIEPLAPNELAHGALELLLDPLPTTPGSVVMHDGKVYARADQVAREHWFCVSDAYGWFDDATLAGATILFDAGATRA